MGLLDSIGGFLSGGGGALLGGVAQMIGADSTNRTNSRIANRQMDFQATMSNTAHQREVEDLKKAGLNPLLSANAGASTPGGASYTAQNPMQGFASTASDAYNAFLANKKQAAEIELLQAQKGKVGKETQALGKDAAFGDVVNKVYENWKKGFQSGAVFKSDKFDKQKMRDSIPEMSQP
jgi:hypothetical protein